MNLANLPIEYRDRPEGSSSKLNTYSDGIKVLLTIFSLVVEYRPLFFFSILSFILAIISCSLFIPILIEYTQTQLVPRFPTLFVSIGIGIFAILSFFTGLILNVVAKKHRQLFEINLNLLCKK